jgi:hypothetical protein
MPSILVLYIAEEDDAGAIVTGEYAAAKDAELKLPEDFDKGALSALNCLLSGCRLDPQLPVTDGEVLAEGADTIVSRAIPEFVERLAALQDGSCQTMATRWADFLSDGEEEGGWWTLAKARRVLTRLSAFARRARTRDLPVLLASTRF